MIPSISAEKKIFNLKLEVRFSIIRQGRQQSLHGINQSIYQSTVFDIINKSTDFAANTHKGLHTTELIIEIQYLHRLSHRGHLIG